MSQLDELAVSYEHHIEAPWQRNLAGAQRIIFVVYRKEEERRLRARLGDFKTRTEGAGHGWREVDFTNAFASWMGEQDYLDRYFSKPKLLKAKLEAGGSYGFIGHCVQMISNALGDEAAGEESVVAIYGVGSLFGFTQLHEILAQVQQEIKGRLVVFFPGTHEEQVYRLLDAREGWDYLATPITA